MPHTLTLRDGSMISILAAIFATEFCDGGEGMVVSPMIGAAD